MRVVVVGGVGVVVTGSSSSSSSNSSGSSIVFPFLHRLSLLEVVGDMLLPLIPGAQIIAAEATGPATGRALRSFLPS